MAKRKYNKTRKSLKKVFGDKINLYDLGMIAILICYLIGVYNGVNTPLWRIFEVFAGALFFALVVRQFNMSLLKKTKK